MHFICQRLFQLAFRNGYILALSENISKLQAHKADILLLHDAYDFLFGKSRRFLPFLPFCFPPHEVFVSLTARP